MFFAKNTLASGSTWEIVFSRDPKQRFIYPTDGNIYTTETYEGWKRCACRPSK